MLLITGGGWAGAGATGGVSAPLAGLADAKREASSRSKAEPSRRVSTQLDGIEAQEREIALLLRQAAAQRQNILRAAFAGQLVPQDSADEPAGVLLERIRAKRAAQAAAPKFRRQRAAKATA